MSYGARDLAKRELEDAIHQRAIEIAIECGENYYFCNEIRQMELEFAAKKDILAYLASQGMV